IRSLNLEVISLYRWVLVALQGPDRQAPALQVPTIPAVTARKMKTLMTTVQQCY
ncbi:Hypothetical predicted protein, partial [Paramuricea clavata]